MNADELKRHPGAALACGEVALLGPDERLLGFRPLIVPSWHTQYLSPGQLIRLIERSDNWIVGSSTVLRRGHLDDIGGFDESLGSFCDGMAVRRLAFRYGFCFIPDVVAIWRRSAKSYSSATALINQENVRVFNRALERLEASIDARFASVYLERFKRRWRFGTAMSILFWEPAEAEPDADTLVIAMGGNQRDGSVLRGIATLGRFRRLRRFLSLVWILLRTGPMHPGALMANLLRQSMQYPVRAWRLRRQLERASLHELP